MESKPKRAVNYLLFIDCTLDAVQQNNVTGQATPVARRPID